MYFTHWSNIYFTRFNDAVLISRYDEANLRRSNELRRYNLLLPKFLHNRPYPFAKRCVEKIELAKTIGENRI